MVPADCAEALQRLNEKYSDIQIYYDFGPSPLGFGLSGNVYANEPTEAGIATVIKRPTGLEASSVESMQVEQAVFAKLLNNLPYHPNIVRCFALNPNDFSIVMERLGPSLRTTLESIRTPSNADPIPFPTRVRWACEFVSALAYLHSLGILHGDISTHNILLDQASLHVKVIDFAGSCVDGKQSVALYSTRNCSPRYVNKVGITVGTEVFAVGSVLYEIATGWEPFPALSQAEVEHRYAAGNFPALDEEVDGVDGLGGLGRVIRKCWDEDYSGMEEIGSDLRGMHSSLNENIELYVRAECESVTSNT
ncbi:kinase-like domain-containing protein [Tirmania nivea]|nr:kinase-like domain-containing protein [Tirmania nivea]